MAEPLDDVQVQRLLEGASWTWASSARYQSAMLRHQYSLKRWWANAAAFETCLAWVQQYGELNPFGRTSYLEWVAGAWFYWTALAEAMIKAWSELLNRKPIEMRNFRRRTKAKPAVTQLPLL